MMSGYQFVDIPCCLLICFMSTTLLTTSLEAFVIQEMPYHHRYARITTHPRDYATILASPVGSPSYLALPERYLGRQSTADYYLNALSSGPGNGPSGRRSLPVPWAEAILGMANPDTDGVREAESSEEDYDEDTGYQIVEEEYPTGYEEEWTEPEEDSDSLQRHSSLDDVASTRGRNADLYDRLMRRYFLMMRGVPSRSSDEESNKPRQVPERRKSGSFRFLSRSSEPQENEETTTLASTPSEDFKASSTTSSTTTIEGDSTQASAAEEFSTPMPPVATRGTVKKFYPRPTPLTSFSALQRGQKEYPLLRPASEHRPPSPTWSSFVEDDAISQESQDKDSSSTLKEPQSSSPSQSHNSLRSNEMPADVLMAQLDSLKKQTKHQIAE